MNASTKRRSHKQRLLDLLSDGRAHHMSELIQVGGYRYGGRLFELRHEGHIIETLHIIGDEYEYRLISRGQMAIPL